MAEADALNDRIARANGLNVDLVKMNNVNISRARENHSGALVWKTIEVQVP